MNLALHQLEMDKVHLRSQSDAAMKDMEMSLRQQLTESSSKMGEKIQKLVAELERTARREEDCLALVEKMKHDHAAEHVLREQQVELQRQRHEEVRTSTQRSSSTTAEWRRGRPGGDWVSPREAGLCSAGGEGVV